MTRKTVGPKNKFVVFALLGFAFGLVSLRTNQSPVSGRSGSIGYILAMTGFGLVGIGALGFWLVPWGSYAGTIRQSALYQNSSILMFVSPVILGIGIILFGIDMIRKKPLSRGNWVPLLIGVAAFSPYLLWTNIGFLFGILWGFLGLVMITEFRSKSSAI